jgi:hypothetical protein
MYLNGITIGNNTILQEFEIDQYAIIDKCNGIADLTVPQGKAVLFKELCFN